MEREQLLEQKLRRSDSLGQEAIFLDFMDYAKEVRDEEEVLLYMEEQGIGTTQAAYWVARLEVMRRQCRLVSLVALLNSLKQQPHLTDSWQLDRYERKLSQHMRSVLAIHCKGRRRAAEVSRVVEGVQQQRRRIGNIQVYVDESCRRYYELEDMAMHIERKMQDYCQVEREDYRRSRQRRPPSFIAKKEQRLMDLAQEVLGKAARRSEQQRASVAPNRPSVRPHANSNKFEVESFNTPKTQEPKLASASAKEELREKRKKDSSRDSIEILKSIRRQRREEPDFKSPRFPQDEEAIMPLQEVPVGKVRSVPQPNDFFSFSFGKKERSPLAEERRMSQREVERDNAFMFASFSQDSRLCEKQNLNVIRKEDFQLELIIKEIQRENYEKADAKTFSSEIGSNQENQGFARELPEGRDNRRPFEILLQAETQHLPPQQSMRLQELMDFDDELDGNPQETRWGSNRKRQSQAQGELQFHSEGKRNMWEIRQQNSHFYSESKCKHSRSK